jgi:GTP-binding protein
VNIEATFVRSAASARDLPRDGRAEMAFVGRSNVGKSTLINALVGHRVARTSGAPGKTRLANVYRIAPRRTAGRPKGGEAPFYLVVVPGFGYARGDTNELAEVTRAYFEGAPPDADRPNERERDLAALLLVDARHPGLPTDLAAWNWLRSTVDRAAIVATKIDKLSRAERLRAIANDEAVFQHPVLPVSAASGEGLDQLWTLIDQLLNSSHPPRNSPNRVPSPMAAEARRRRPHPKSWSSRRSKT